MKIKSLALGAAVSVMILAVPATTFAGFYPADRQTYTCGATRPDGSTPCEGADHVVFNSFTNNPIVGDERPFFSGSMDNGATAQDRIKVKDGDVVTLRAFVHNNADPNKIGKEAAMAKNVKITVGIPDDKESDHNLVTFISAKNVSAINDTMSIYGDSAMTLSYVQDSAYFDYAPDGLNKQHVKVDNTIATTEGAYLGSLNGCFQYSGFVTLKVKVSMPSTPVTPPKTTTPAKPAELPHTGASDVVATVLGVSIVAAIAHRLYTSRRFAK